MNRFVLDYESDAMPFRDVFEQPHGFRFFLPDEDDLRLPVGLVLNSGRSSLSDDPGKRRWAVNTFNSGKATPDKDLPDEHPLYLSPAAATARGLADGDGVRVVNPSTGQGLAMTVAVNERLTGELAYVPFHKDRLQAQGRRYINTVTSQAGRCPYTAQTSVKATIVELEKP